MPADGTAPGEVVHWFDLRTVPATPWKNGGGSTRELVCWPPGAGTDAFGWRVSVARIAAPGPFSAFTGVNRQIMLLDGDGVQLASAAAGIDHALQQRWQPFAFAGDAALDCSLLGGTSTDFNLMLRRGAWSGHLQVLREVPSQTQVQTQAGLCMVLQGRWQGPRLLAPGQGLWWTGGQAERIAPVAGSADPVLAWIALEQKI